MFPQEGPSERADAATKSWLQLYKSSGAGDAFDSETIKGAATTELVANKYRGGRVHALHAIEQTVGSDVQYKNHRSDGTILMLVGPTKGGDHRLGRRVDELEEAAPRCSSWPRDSDQGRRHWWTSRPRAGVAPRCSSWPRTRPRAASTKKKRPRVIYDARTPGASSRYSAPVGSDAGAKLGDGSGLALVRPAATCLFGGQATRVASHEPASAASFAGIAATTTSHQVQNHDEDQ